MKISDFIEQSAPNLTITAIKGLRDKFIEHVKIEELDIDLTVDESSKKINNFTDKSAIQMFYSFLWGGFSNLPLLVLNFEAMLPGIMCWIETLPKDQKEPAIKTIYQINNSFEAIYDVTFWPKEIDSNVISSYEKNLSNFRSHIAVEEFETCLAEMFKFIDTWNDPDEDDFSYQALIDFMFFLNELFEKKFGKGFMKVEEKRHADFKQDNSKFEVVH